MANYMDLHFWPKKFGRRKKSFIFAVEKVKNLSMAKTVIIVKNVATGVKTVFSTLEDASKALGVSCTSLSLACVDSRPTMGYLVKRVDRVYALHLRAHNEWIVAVGNARNDGYLELENPSRRIGRREIDRIKDITLGWHMQEEGYE